MTTVTGNSSDKDPNEDTTCTAWFEIIDDEEHHRYARPRRLNDKRTRHAIRRSNIRT